MRSDEFRRLAHAAASPVIETAATKPVARILVGISAVLRNASPLITIP
jgi:hypothetical protein